MYPLDRPGLRLGVAVAHLALGLQSGELPFLDVDLAVLVEIEALDELLLILLPVREQCAHVGAFILRARDLRALRGSISYRVAVGALQDQPLGVALVGLGPALVLLGEHLGAVGRDDALAGSVDEQ